MKYLIFAIIIFFSFNTYGQIDSSKCLSDSYILPTDDIYLPTNTTGSGEFLRILIIYVTFPDDNDNGLSWNVWPNPYGIPQGTRPYNAYTNDGTFIDPSKESGSAMDKYRDYTYSDYFSEMSMGTMDVIGDEVYMQIPYPSSVYLNNGTSAPGLNNFILTYAYNNLGVDYSDYDNWTLNGSKWEWGGDGKPEMVVIQFRKIPSGYESYYWGGATPGGSNSLFLSSPLTLGGATLTAGCGVSTTQGMNNTTRLMSVPIHEMCHNIFGNYFSHHGFNWGHTSIGLMTEAHALSTLTMLPMERSMPGMDWTTPTEVNSGNLQTNYTLGDFIETGNCLKVAIPNTSPQEYFWVSNHQKKSVYDGVARGGKGCVEGYEFYNSQDPYCDEGKGLFIFSESDKDCANNIHGFGQGDRHFAFDLLSAEGKFNWATDRYVSGAPYGVGNINIQKEVTGNRVSGQSKFNNHWLQPSTWSAQLLNNEICSQDGDYNVTADFHGTGLMAYNMGYDEIFSPYSNPATNSCANPSTNSGVTFKLLSQNNTTGAITLKIYYNDITALSDLPPSKPKLVKCEKEELTSGFHPKLTWDANIEPDFDPEEGPGGVYKIYRGASYNCSVEPTYTYVTSVPYYTTEYIDESVTLHDKGLGGINCGDDLVTYSYKISAVDENDDESLKSERALVSGYMEPCLIGDPESRPGHAIIENGLPTEFKLFQNYPNPFNPVTNIQYDLSQSGLVKIKVYDMLGKEVASLVNEYKMAGSYLISFNASSLSSGVYFYKIETPDFVQTKRMILMK